MNDNLKFIAFIVYMILLIMSISYFIRGDMLHAIFFMVNAVLINTVKSK